jgi:hypothetical protein
LSLYLGFGEVYNGQKQVLGTDDTCPQGSLSLSEDKVEVAVNVIRWNGSLKSGWNEYIRFECDSFVLWTWKIVEEGIVPNLTIKVWE